MPFNGAGSYSPPGTNFPAVANTLILSNDYNTVVNDISTALSGCITKDGQTTVTANIPFNNFKLTGIAAATARTDAAQLAQIQDGAPLVVGTVGGTANAITGSLTPAIAAYATGHMVILLPTNANTAATTLALNGLAAKNIFYGGAALTGGELKVGVSVLLHYDGTQYNIVGTGAINGTFTPTVKFGGLAVGVTYAAQNGTYTKIGSLVLYDINLTLSSKGSSVGNATINSLPFTVSTSGTGTGVWSNMTATLNSMNFVGDAATVQGKVYGQAAAGASSVQLTDASFANNSNVHISGFYWAQ